MYREGQINFVFTVVVVRIVAFTDLFRTDRNRFVDVDRGLDVSVFDACEINRSAFFCRTRHAHVIGIEKEFDGFCLGSAKLDNLCKFILEPSNDFLDKLGLICFLFSVCGVFLCCFGHFEHAEVKRLAVVFDIQRLTSLAPLVNGARLLRNFPIHSLS